MNTSDIWQDDLLDRSLDAEFLIRFLTYIGRVPRTPPAAYVINLDAPWGAGKTFFMRRLFEQLVQLNYVTVYVNAWEDDFADDPLIPVISCIDDLISSQFEPNQSVKRAWKLTRDAGMKITLIAAKGIVSQLLRRGIGNALDEISEELRSGTAHQENISDTENNIDIKQPIFSGIDSLLDSHMNIILNNFKEGKASIESFCDKLNVTLEAISRSKKGVGLPFFVLVDELDRCRPIYAIRFLERIRHLFGINNVVFIISTDSTQLCHSINAVYGTDFDSKKYLGRFFDRNYRFRSPTHDDYIKFLTNKILYLDNKLSSFPGNDMLANNRKYFSDSVKFFHLELRDINQCFDILETVLLVWPYNSSIDLIYMFPLIVAAQQGDKAFFDDLAALNEKRVTEKFNEYANSYDWNHTFHYREYNRSEESVKMTNILLYTIKLARYNLSEIPSEPPSSIHQRWIWNKFLDELRTEHGNSYSSSSPPKSLHHMYSEFVRNANRLTRYFEEAQSS